MSTHSIRTDKQYTCASDSTQITGLTNTDELAVNRPEAESVETPKSNRKTGVSVPAKTIIDNCVPANRASHEQLFAFALKLASHWYRVDLRFHKFKVSARTVLAL